MIFLLGNTLILFHVLH